MIPASFLGIAVADHVVEEYDGAHLCEGGAADLAVEVEAAAVAVWAEDACEFP